MGTVRQIYSDSDAESLPDVKTLWRYLSLKRLFPYLKGKVFIPSIAKLREEDPFEGEFLCDITWFNQALHDRFGPQHKSVLNWIHDKLCTEDQRRLIEVNRAHTNYAAKIYQQHYLDFLRTTRFAWCWFQSGIESAAMWNTYGRDGVAVGTTVGKLKLALQGSGRDFAFGKMTYVQAVPRPVLGFDPEDTKQRQLLLMPHFLKRKEYGSENEVRFVTSGTGNPTKPGITVDLPPQDWIGQIRLSPTSSSSEEQALTDLVEKFVPSALCSRSCLLQRNDRPGALRAQLASALDESAESAWRRGHDGIPSIVKEI